MSEVNVKTKDVADVRVKQHTFETRRYAIEVTKEFDRDDWRQRIAVFDTRNEAIGHAYLMACKAGNSPGRVVSIDVVEVITSIAPETVSHVNLNVRIFGGCIPGTIDEYQQFVTDDEEGF